MSGLPRTAARTPAASARNVAAASQQPLAETGSQRLVLAEALDHAS